MKTIKTMILCFYFISTGAVSKDYDHYVNNIDEATLKVQQCEALLKAFSDVGNTENMIEIMVDVECNNAKKAIQQAEFEKSAIEMMAGIRDAKEERLKNDAKKLNLKFYIKNIMKYL